MRETTSRMVLEAALVIQQTHGVRFKVELAETKLNAEPCSWGLSHSASIGQPLVGCVREIAWSIFSAKAHDS